MNYESTKGVVGVKKNKKASMSYVEAREKKLRIKQNIALGMAICSLAISVIAIIKRIMF